LCAKIIEDSQNIGARKCRVEHSNVVNSGIRPIGTDAAILRITKRQRPGIRKTASRRSRLAFQLTVYIDANLLRDSVENTCNVIPLIRHRNCCTGGGIVLGGRRVARVHVHDESAIQPAPKLQVKVRNIVGRHTHECLRSGILRKLYPQRDGIAADRIEYERLGNNSAHGGVKLNGLANGARREIEWPAH